MRALSSIFVLGATFASFATLSGALRAETNEPVAVEANEITVGTALVAVADVNLQKAALLKGARVQVTKLGLSRGRVASVDVELADGHVVRRISIETINKAFVVAPTE